MSKYCGKLGFVETVEVEKGIYEEQIIERTYKGDILSSRVYRESPDKVNGDIKISNSVSVICDAYLQKSAMALRYATWMGTKWSISSIEIQRPRVILTLGGVYSETED